MIQKSKRKLAKEEAYSRFLATHVDRSTEVRRTVEDSAVEEVANTDMLWDFLKSLEKKLDTVQTSVEELFKKMDERLCATEEKLSKFWVETC